MLLFVCLSVDDHGVLFPQLPARFQFQLLFYKTDRPRVKLKGLASIL